ncbi:ribosomal protein S5 domain 2-type protein [Collybia nuda]|uniref:Ribosomal protein S5 domain 2-type protein n=1 Tax=Collybia nuda TaxID=64659 RepID=A0A9P5Y1S3_9AGAR|nr:ribosomal protein S5 domain 2-type protein [Collybia nuda]
MTCPIFFLIRNEDWPYPIYASDRLRDRKSVFLAHASTLPISSAFPTFLNHLTSLPSLKRATHCMYAYRTSGPNGPISGQHDGAESGSGDRLSRLLESSGCVNVVVVVSRWYGGVKLGSDRWKRISDVAKEALARGEFSNRNQPNNASTGIVRATKGRQRKK